MASAADPSEVTQGDEHRIRPRLRHDVVFAETGDGVLLRDSDSGFVIKGRSAYRLASLIIPYLTGEHSLGDLCSDLPSAHREMVTSMVRALLDRGLARDAQPGSSAILDERVSARFQPQLNFIDHYADAPAVRFSSFRSARVLIAGSGETAIAAGLSLLRNGLEHLAVTGEPVPAELRQEVAALSAGGCAAAVSGTARAVADLGDADLTPYDIVLLTSGCGGDMALDQLFGLMSTARTGGPVLLPGVILAQRAILGPAVRPGASPCWVCALLRLDRNLGTEMSGLWRKASLAGMDGTIPGVVQPVARMIGNMLAFDVFRLRTGAVTADTASSLVVQDLTTLESTRNHVLPYPGCPVCGDHGTKPVQPAPGPEELSDDKLIERRQKALFGRYAGIVSGFADGALTQSPVKVARLRTGLPGGGVREITAFDVHTAAAARDRALDAVAAAYADDIASLHRAVTNAASELGGNGPAARRVAPTTLLTWTGLADDHDGETKWLPAISLAAGDVHWVPAAAVYPFSAVNARGAFEPTSAGAGAGRTAAEADKAALLSAAAYLALRAVISGTAVARPLAPGAFRDDAETEFLMGAAATLGREVTLLQMGGAEPVHVVLGTIGTHGTDRPGWAISAGSSARDAALTVLRDLIGSEQTLAGQPDGSPPDLGSTLLPDFDPRTIRATDAAGTGTEGTRQPALSARAMAGQLRACGYGALAVDTTPPDLQGTGLFATARVLLSRL